MARTRFVEFEKVERLPGVYLPQDYIEWFQRYDAVEFDEGEASILFDGDGYSYQFDEFSELDSLPYKVEEWYTEEGELKKRNLLVPFGFNSVLDPYCFYFWG